MTVYSYVAWYGLLFAYNNIYFVIYAATLQDLEQQLKYKERCSQAGLYP